MEYHGVERNSEEIPPLKVTIVKGKEDICVKLSDRGGGIPRSQVDQLFKYMYSTAPQPPVSNCDLPTVPLAGQMTDLKKKLVKLIKYFFDFRLRIWSTNIQAIRKIFPWRLSIIIL